MNGTKARRGKLPPVVSVEQLQKKAGRSFPKQLGTQLLMGDLSILLKNLTDAAEVVKRIMGRM